MNKEKVMFFEILAQGFHFITEGAPGGDDEGLQHAEHRTDAESVPVLRPAQHGSESNQAGAHGGYVEEVIGSDQHHGKDDPLQVGHADRLPVIAVDSNRDERVAAPILQPDGSIQVEREVPAKDHGTPVIEMGADGGHCCDSAVLLPGRPEEVQGLVELGLESALAGGVAEEEKSGGWFGWGAGDRDKPASSKADAKDRFKGLKFPEFSFGQGLGLVVVQFFTSIAVLVMCAALIGERVENLGMKASGAIFAQRFLMFAAFLWISHTTMKSFVPHAITMGDIAKVLLTPILAELGIMTVILRYTICDVFARAIMLSIVFCVIDAMAQGVLFIGAIVLVS